jgi:hypothetical protein
VNNGVPAILGLLPLSVSQGSVAQTLIINGTNFLPNSTVTFNGVMKTATYVNSAQLTISLSAADQATPGSYPVVVSNPAPGGGTSNSAAFTVNGLQPQLYSLSPSYVSAGASARVLTITGSNFVPSSTATFNGMSHTATFISSTQLTMALSPTDLAAPGYFAVVVNNQATGGGVSNSVFFTVNDATPACGSEPKSQSVTAPASATFCISPPGTGSPSYQWYKNGTLISGATSSSYTTPPTTWGTNGAS